MNIWQFIKSYLRKVWELFSKTPTQVQMRADILVANADKMVGVSGEYKRHIVYAQLLKEFPGIPKRDLGFAIEHGVQKL